MSSRPNPFEELRVGAVATLRGANYWSSRPVTRLDLEVGAFDEISSADVPGFPSRLMAALPGLREHRCSLGKPGGFELRLRRGTYAPHIIEHVALELQTMVGHRVGYGRARGGERRGEYTVVVEHRHSEVGRKSLLLALEMVCTGLACEPIDPEAALDSLARTAAEPDPAPAVDKHVACGIIGGSDTGAAREEILGRLGSTCGPIVVVSPARLLHDGLPYSKSDTAVVLDLVPDPKLSHRYRDEAALRRLYSVVTDGVPEGGWIVVPADDAEMRMIVRNERLRPATFGGGSAADGGLRAFQAGRSIVVESRGRRVHQAPRTESADVGVQMAASLVTWILETRSR